jgi:hypothetical protein
MLAASAVTVVTYNTNATGGTGTGFSNAGALVLAKSSGPSALLTYDPNANSTTGVPSNIDYGDSTLVCATCTVCAGSSFSAFTFDLVITAVTDGAVGEFIGTSSGGSVYSNISQISINWAPLALGPGTTSATSGSFGSTIFSTTAYTGIVAPNSGGGNPGQTTVQGHIESTPEPATLRLLDGSLLGLGLWRRKQLSRQ